MTALIYIFLGMIQGMTETIPVSSSGHLMIVKNLLGKLKEFNMDYDAFSIITNFGSLIAIIIIFWDDIKAIICDFFMYIKTKEEKRKANYNYAWMIALGCIPAGFTGLLVDKLELFDSIENNIKIVGLSLIITSILLFLVRNFNGKKGDKQLGIKEALTVGCFQIMGLFPGISRSGSTIVGGMTQGLKRDTAFKYSFMLYIPMSIAAMGLKLTEISIPSNMIIYYVLAFFTSLIVTYLVTRWFRKVINKGKLIYFSLYCFIVGTLVILFLN